MRPRHTNGIHPSPSIPRFQKTRKLYDLCRPLPSPANGAATPRHLSSSTYIVARAAWIFQRDQTQALRFLSLLLRTYTDRCRVPRVERFKTFLNGMAKISSVPLKALVRREIVIKEAFIDLRLLRDKKAVSLELLLCITNKFASDFAGNRDLRCFYIKW